MAIKAVAGKHVFLSVLAFAIIALFAAQQLTDSGPPEQHAGFPWEVQVLESGHSQVFSLTLGKSTLAQAEKLFREVAELTLFSDEGSEPAVEAFFEEVKIAGLKAKMVMAIDIPQVQLNSMFDRGVRIATLGSGTRKVTLSSADAQSVRSLPITSITYLPAINLSAELVEKRFGPPTEKLADPSSDAVHWLYPELGVDIALSEEKREVIQYVQPDNFAALVAPLKQLSPDSASQ
jgi:hypothetical protein